MPVSEVREVQAKILLTKFPSDDNWLSLLYNANFYRGCGHGCIYCDTRSECYGIVDIDRIAVKANAIDLLREELPRKRVKGVIGTGSMNDPYMPLEMEVGLVRKALGVMAEFGFPAHIVTKSALVLRDLDILSEMARSFALVTFSVATADDGLGRKLEPGASLPSERLAAMGRLREAGVTVGVAMCPIIAGMTDSRESMNAVVEAAGRHGAMYVLPGLVTLRDAQRDYFYRHLREVDPGALRTLSSLYGNAYLPPKRYADRIYGIAGEAIKMAGLATRCPRWKSGGGRSPQLSLF